jgi:ATP-dependent helicase/nuclease subunit B
LLQLKTVLQALEYVWEPTEDWIAWARKLDEPAGAPKPCAAPEPKPPVKDRPRALRVTDIGTWRRNPYAIYARRILSLQKLEPLESDMTAAKKGSIIHEVLEKFLRSYPDKLPANPLDELLALGREVFAPYRDQPQVMAFWWPRFERIACWFIDQERTRRAANIKTLQAEAEGSVVLNGLTLKGRADRIDRLPDGTLEIIDYKTGKLPSQTAVKTGLEPQLPLLALIASEGGFKGLPAATASALSYWKLSGGAEAGEEQIVKEPVDALMKTAREGLENLIKNFADLNMPYRAVPKPSLRPDYDDYEHLARLAEWGRAAGDA